MLDQPRWKGSHLIGKVTRTALVLACLLYVNLGVGPSLTALAQSGDKGSDYTQKTEQNAQDAYQTSVRAMSGDAFEAAHEALLERDNLQFERPVIEVEPPEFRKPSPFFNWLGQLFSGLGPLFQLLFYLGAAAIAAGILYFILRQIPNIRLQGLRRKDKVTEEDDHVISNVRPDEKKARAWLEEADALAKEGRFSEAVHLLLFRSIEDIQSKRKAPIPQALTSREIERLDGLPTGPRNALRPIISLVERSFFGGHSVNAENWTSARAAYETFAFGDAWA